MVVNVSSALPLTHITFYISFALFVYLGAFRKHVVLEYEIIANEFRLFLDVFITHVKCAENKILLDRWHFL